MYRIMEVVKHKENYGSLYRYMIDDSSDEIKPIEIETDAELDDFVEDLLNNQGYSKDDFVIVDIKDYEISVDIIDD